MSSRISRIVYAASTMGENAFSNLFINSNSMPGQQAQKYNRLLQQGLSQNGVEVIAISTPPIRKKVKKVFLCAKNSEEKGVLYKYAPVVNLLGLKNLVFVVYCFLISFFSLHCKKTVAVCDILNVSASIGVVTAAKIKGIPVVGIVTDVPELMVTGHTKKQVKLCNLILENCDGYIFLAEAMNDRLNTKKKPYIVIEGIADATVPITDYKATNSGRKKCLYAGLIDAEYGVKNMVDGFLRASIPDAELHLCGTGRYEMELREIAKENKNIVYHGLLLNSEVAEMERDCVLLVNPRPSTEEFTKYSFPSKIIEYMASGTATMATILAGIPKEYYEYLIAIDEEDADGMSKMFTRILEKDENELKCIGREAQKWIIKNKSSVVQARKLLSFMQNELLRY